MVIPSLRRTAVAVALTFGLGLSACGEDSTTTVGTNEPSETTATASDQGAGTGAIAASIAGDWILTGLTVDGNDVELPPYDLPLVIDRGTISGNGGCNSFSGTIEGDPGSTMSVSQLGGTEMACEYLDFETIYLGALSTLASATSGPDGSLTLTGPTFEARYQAAPPVAAASLTGTVWRLDTIYGPGEGPVRSASSVDQQGAPALLTVVGETATISGDCGDWALGGAFEEGNQGGNWRVTDTGEVSCGAEGGVGDNQQVAYDAAVAATGYMIDGQRLILLGQEGELVGFVNDDLASTDGASIDE